jgi:hypothetical protein
MKERSLSSAEALSLAAVESVPEPDRFAPVPVAIPLQAPQR